MLFVHVVAVMMAGLQNQSLVSGLFRSLEKLNLVYTVCVIVFQGIELWWDRGGDGSRAHTRL